MVSKSFVPQDVNEEILSLFQPIEGWVSFYYGRIRNGKTHAASRDIIDLLKRGEVVYANWQVVWNGYDERDSWKVVFLKWLFKRKYYFKYDVSNFHLFSPDDVDVEFLGRLVGVHIFIDEGQWLFNSQVRHQDDNKRRLVLHNGHYCRSLNIISQRPVNIFKDMRSQVNIWYKCEKLLSFANWILFRRTEYEDMKDDLPDEENPTGKPKFYLLNTKSKPIYDTHAMRSSDAVVELSKFEVYRRRGVFERLKGMFDRKVKAPRAVREERTIRSLKLKP